LEENEILHKNMIEELNKSVTKQIKSEVHKQTSDIRQSPFQDPQVA